MNPIFRQMVYFSAAKPMVGGVQMAIDELLLAEVEGVVLREYLWESETVSVGYFGESAEVVGVLESACFVRRPTGGGLVRHGHGRDYTYSIVIGAAVAKERKLALRESYRVIHGILADVLCDFGVEATLAGSADLASVGGSACFVNPVGDDLVRGGEKIAGAGQKRSRGAILHQGSVQPVELPGEFGVAFAARLGNEVVLSELDAEFLRRAEALAAVKYQTDAWNLRC